MKIKIYVGINAKGQYMVVSDSDLDAESSKEILQESIEDVTITEHEIEIEKPECELCQGSGYVWAICINCSGNGCRVCRGLGERKFECDCRGGE